MLVVRTLPKRLVICALSLQLLYLPVDATAAEKLNAAEAARLLQQASFGPTLSDIQAAGQFTAEQWIDWQLSMPATTHADKIETLPEQKTPVPLSRLETWWRIALTAPDQLRQRVAFALSEILVVSDQGNGLNNRVIALANYYDLLLAHSFGNYRELLQQVTLSPVMGVYLSHLGNQKADVANNIRPDENYARELMQLFTIGLYQLNPDGSKKLDAADNPIPTYDQQAIEGFARVFTGWTSAGTTNFLKPKADYLRPMIPFAAYHEPGEKRLLNGVVLPAGQTPQQDLQQALDLLFAEPSLPPFISQQLIQKLVTSNPSPAYVGRVTQVFIDNGQGVRGDLAAVVKAILLDEEARSGFAGVARPFGKIREPLLKTAHSWRVTQSASPSGHIYLRTLADSHNQAPLQSPSVFNFYRPDFSPSASLQQAGLVAPELQMLTASNALNMQNHLYSQTVGSIEGLVANPSQFQMLARFQPFADVLQHQGLNVLLDQFGLLAFGGAMPAELRLILTDLASGLGNITPAQKAAYLWYFILISPQYAVQQ
ncbi:DUF1800 domain-containing protein [Rheinheimera texasensis]|uniref:DUF1800 domain-containing protein n=1 Tax=Rheinheimera texasensis TaxID=306205 RepID=UPI00068A33E8|nr:DUF1800 domain-containing protein [Rheinheimera texasensis]